MTVRQTRDSSPRSRSTRAARAVKRAVTPPKVAADEAVKRTGKTSSAAVAGKAVKKGTAIAARSIKASGPRSRTDAAAKAVELASVPAKTVANEAMKVADEGSNKAVTVSQAGEKEASTTIGSVKASNPPSRSTTAPKVVELASIPPKTSANEAMKFSGEAFKNESVRTIDISEDTVTETLDATEDIAKAASEVVTGVTEMHQMMWSSMQRVMQAAVEMPARFAACISLADLAEIQRQVMRQGFSEWLTISQEILMTNRRITDRAINALELR